ncbi:solute carrier family 23 member 1 [Platysternon megacephalum]|uniref:Solute carrier family 23 member 1 n=1 Tax=Platysternon megacephalum TaxID=55544 RepID=A0A4D9EU91_9SAUR|nr:solute carrier family 23 member 1 [Platysternon megacephalum]
MLLAMMLGRDYVLTIVIVNYEADIWSDHSFQTDPDLPPGWKKINDIAGTYYWHIPTGTTQWERPVSIPTDLQSSRKGSLNSITPSPTPETEKQPWSDFAVLNGGKINSDIWKDLHAATVNPDPSLKEFEGATLRYASLKLSVGARKELIAGVQVVSGTEGLEILVANSSVGCIEPKSLIRNTDRYTRLEPRWLTDSCIAEREKKNIGVTRTAVSKLVVCFRIWLSAINSIRAHSLPKILQSSLFLNEETRDKDGKKYSNHTPAVPEQCHLVISYTCCTPLEVLSARPIELV